MRFKCTFCDVYILAFVFLSITLNSCVKKVQEEKQTEIFTVEENSKPEIEIESQEGININLSNQQDELIYSPNDITRPRGAKTFDTSVEFEETK